MPATKHGAQKSGAQRPQINARLYTAYWSRGVAEYAGQNADVLRIDIRLLPVAISADPPFTIVCHNHSLHCSDIVRVHHILCMK